MRSVSNSTLGVAKYQIEEASETSRRWIEGVPKRETSLLLWLSASPRAPRARINRLLAVVNTITISANADDATVAVEPSQPTEKARFPAHAIGRPVAPAPRFSVAPRGWRSFDDLPFRSTFEERLRC